MGRCWGLTPNIVKSQTVTCFSRCLLAMGIYWEMMWDPFPKEGWSVDLGLFI